MSRSVGDSLVVVEVLLLDDHVDVLLLLLSVNIMNFEASLMLSLLGVLGLLLLKLLLLKVLKVLEMPKLLEPIVMTAAD